jgi:RNA polymerase sigma factor (TIGR02999 family)
MSDVTTEATAEDDGKLSAEEMLPLVYEELRRLAAARMVREYPGQTLQPTALVHEAWLKLNRDGARTWQSHTHFYHAAALAMRQILIDRARQKSALKRAGGWQRIDIEHLNLATAPPEEHLLLIDESLKDLEREDPQSAQLVMLKFFSGLTNKEVAQTLGISEATVERRWAFAKVRLFQIIRNTTQGGKFSDS